MRFGSVVALLALTVASAARADALSWRDEWPHFRTSEHIAAGAMVAGALTLYLLPLTEPRWGEPILFDKSARSALRATRLEDRTLAARISTIAYWSLLADSVVLEGPVVPLARGSREIAAQVTLINLQSLAFTAFVFKVTEVVVARARPFVWDCYESTGSFRSCRESGLSGTNSFFSGHTALASTSAALICTNQLNLKLYGRVGAPVTCGVAIALALTTGVGRIVSDNHYATDIVVAWMVGAVSGWVLPSLLHYGFDGNGVGDRTGAQSAPITIAYASAF